MRMPRQSQTPVQFTKTTRGDVVVGATSDRAGRQTPLDYIPVLAGDSASGRFRATFDLAEMPKPLMNAVFANVQAWFIPKSAMPNFSGYDEFISSKHGKQIKALGETTRDAPDYHWIVNIGPQTTFGSSYLAKTMGFHHPALTGNADFIDAYNLLWNFRAAAHSSKITKRPYSQQGLALATTYAPAFWPTGPQSHMVPDYEQALVVGALDLDVQAGYMPITGLGIPNTATTGASVTVKESNGASVTYNNPYESVQNDIAVRSLTANGLPNVFAQMAGETVATTLASIDKARQTQAFAKLRAAMAGNDWSGFDTDEAILAELMQGLSVPQHLYQRPWLLDQKRVPFGMIERHATDAANLDDSVTKGTASVELSINLPQQETGGLIMIIAEVLPERLFERQGDPFIMITDPSQYPNALRDVQNPEPVDLVPNWRIDAAHTTPEGLYGYEPLNAKWDRKFTRLGGKFLQADPNVPFTEARAGIWNPEYVDPVFSNDHWLAPYEFPHDVFSDTLGDAFEVSFSHNVALRGLTQIGDVLAEDNSEYLLTDV